jgi:hypothetical protein
MSIADATKAADAKTFIDNAERIVRKAFRILTEGPDKPFELPPPPPERLTKSMTSPRGRNHPTS